MQRANPEVQGMKDHFVEGEQTNPQAQCRRHASEDCRLMQFLSPHLPWRL
jgi:hypothetical protein